MAAAPEVTAGFFLLFPGAILRIGRRGVGVLALLRLSHWLFAGGVDDELLPDLSKPLEPVVEREVELVDGVVRLHLVEVSGKLGFRSGKQ